MCFQSLFWLPAIISIASSKYEEEGAESGTLLTPKEYAL